ncbi:hypothetical protein EGW08_005430 [Elysia chlorotica]|uniref:Pleiotropic regulator 1 n=1 Tax=Elysia chlorotica TaxID=188477 RepID=A0A3S1BM64_ELYCH|nr:hypothetical protein EGW08_005430 [Elysia chlorotica]
MATEEVQKHSVHTLVFRSLKRTHDMFLSDQGNTPEKDKKSDKVRAAVKVHDEYGPVKEAAARESQAKQRLVAGGGDGNAVNQAGEGADSNRIDSVFPINEGVRGDSSSRALVAVNIGQQQMLVPKKAQTMPKPHWHPPWKLYRVISGHIGWVRCLAVEPGNEWFCSGAGDRVIKIWDLASGTLKLTLTGHVSTVRGVAVSARQPYLFSCGEDKMVKCWDLEQNKTIRHYHGHLSACYALALHPTIDILTTCGRDGTVRIWDVRTKACVHTLTGHTNTVADVKCQAPEPQVISGSHDCTVRLWDLAMGRTRVTLTNHKKSVRAVAIHPVQYSFASGSPDNIKQWKFPDGNFMQNLSGHNSIVNSLACNSDGVLVSAADNGSMYFWDWRTGYNFQRIQAAVQPGSIHSEAGIFTLQFDQSGSRLITGETDKTIKIYKEDETATEETHPINWRPDIYRKKKY